MTSAAAMDLKRYVASINLTSVQNLMDNRFDNHNNTAYAPAWWESAPVLLLALLYVLIICGGVFGNASLLLTICTQTSARFRNPLLVALCVADLMVAGVAAPLTLLALLTVQQRWSLSALECKSIYFMQALPVAASTICLLMLSLDRYATVKHPRLAQLRERRFLPIVLAASAWLGAFILCAPLLIAYRAGDSAAVPPLPTPAAGINHTAVTRAPIAAGADYTAAPPAQLPQHPHSPHRQLISRSSSSSAGSHHPFSAAPDTCFADFGTAQLHTAFVSIYAAFVFVLPALGVLLNHLGVRKKLCALSLTARAAHGELPLPMPILRRPTHMIIVTGMANAGRAVVDPEDSCCSDDDDDGGHNDENGDVTVSPRRSDAAPLPPLPPDGAETDAALAAAATAAVAAQTTTTTTTTTTTKADDVLATEAADNNGTMDEKRCMMAETRMRCNPRTPRSIRRGQMAQSLRNNHHPHPHHHHRHGHRNTGTAAAAGAGSAGNNYQQQRRNNNNRGGGGGKMPSSELPLPQTSTLRSRRRLANLLVFAAGIFICCWTPHVVCFLGVELGGGGDGDGGDDRRPMCANIVSEFTLLLGYAHSAISPLLYWVLNHNSLRQSSSCGTILRLSSIQKFMRAHLRVPAPPPPPSSTNEAALGPFNPRYIKARPQPPHHYRPPASSYNLY